MGYYEVRIYKTGTGSHYETVGSLLTGNNRDVKVQHDLLQQVPSLSKVWEISGDKEDGLDLAFKGDRQLSEDDRDNKDQIEQASKASNNIPRYFLRKALFSEKSKPAGKEDNINTIKKILINNLLTYTSNYPSTKLKISLLGNNPKIYMLFPVERENNLSNSFVTLELLSLQKKK